MIIGAAGSRHGMTPQQTMVFTNIVAQKVGYDNLERVGPGRKDHFHHGACVGADEQMVQIAKEKFGFWTIAHPSLFDGLVTRYPSDVTLKPMEALLRNMIIVYVCQFFIAAPATRHEVRRSGTWAAIRAARSRTVPGVIIHPSGSTEEL